MRVRTSSPFLTSSSLLCAETKVSSYSFYLLVSFIITGTPPYLVVDASAAIASAFASSGLVSADDVTIVSITAVDGVTSVQTRVTVALLSHTEFDVTDVLAASSTRCVWWSCLCAGDVRLCLHVYA
jgi:hypothetical protein